MDLQIVGHHWVTFLVLRYEKEKNNQLLMMKNLTKKPTQPTLIIAKKRIHQISFIKKVITNKY